MRCEETGRYVRERQAMSPSNDASPNDSRRAFAANFPGGGGGGG